MRTAAGILLITIGVINIGGAIAYSFLGKISSTIGEVGETVSGAGEQASLRSGDQDGQKVAGAAKEVSWLVKMMGNMARGIGIVLLLLAGAQIAAGVFAFEGKRLGLILGVSVAEILLSILILLTIPGPTCPIFGLATSTLAIFMVIEEQKSARATEVPSDVFI